jgi:hypothetical protein
MGSSNMINEERQSEKAIFKMPISVVVYLSSKLFQLA